MVGTWKLLNTSTTGTGTTTISSGTFTASDYLRIIIYYHGIGEANPQVRFNNDSNSSNYYNTYRVSNSSNSTGNTQSSKFISYSANGTPQGFMQIQVMNLDNEEKLVTASNCEKPDTNASSAPNYIQWVGKYTVKSGQVTEVSLTSNGSNFGSESYISVYGASDDVLTDEKTTLTNVPVNTRYEETDTRKIYRRTSTTDVTIADSGTTAGGLGGASGTISKVGAKLDDSSYSYIGKTITQVKFRVKKSGSPTGNGSCHVYASSDANMTGTPKATSSSTVDWATLPSSNPTAGTFSATFDFSGFTLADGDRLVITGGSYSNSNEVQALRDSSATNSSWKTAFGYNNGNSTYVSTDTMNLEFTINEGSWIERNTA